MLQINVVWEHTHGARALRHHDSEHPRGVEGTRGQPMLQIRPRPDRQGRRSADLSGDAGGDASGPRESVTSRQLRCDRARAARPPAWGGEPTPSPTPGFCGLSRAVASSPAKRGRIEEGAF